MNNTLLYIITVVIWGTTWIAINYQLGDVAVEASITYRFGLAAIVLFVFCYIKKLPVKFSIAQHGIFLAFGVTLFGGNYFFLYLSQEHINSALSSIAFSTLMLANIINARIWYKTEISKQVYLGGALGLFGIVTLFWPQINDVQLSTATFTGLGLALLGVFLASLGNMLSIKNQKDKLPIVQSNAWGMTYGALFMGMTVLIQGNSFTFSYTLTYISSLLYLSIFGSVIAFGCYLSLLNKIGPHKASYSAIMFPAIAVAISTVIEGFVWNSYTISGFICMVIGNIVVLAKPNDKIKQLNPLQIKSQTKILGG